MKKLGRKPLPPELRRQPLPSSTIAPETFARIRSVMESGKNLGQAIDFLVSKARLKSP